MSADTKRALLRHAVATLAYRAGKSVRDAPGSFADLEVAPGTRTPARILAHMGDLMDWALSQASGQESWSDSRPLSWPEEVSRFFAAARRFDDHLASDEPLHVSEERLFQGPVADALWHAGQLAMLRRLAGSPIRGENFSLAEIESGRVGEEQHPPRREFD